jgi:hypothetical protein
MTDLVLAAWVSGLIELSKVRGALDANGLRKPSAKLKLLFAAYNGARNTGEDVRVEEMVRQFRRVLGEGNVDISVLTLDFERSRGYFEGATQVELPFVFPPFLWREIPRYDGVVACLGGMFQRTFSNAIVTLMTGALGIASARKKLSIAYGFEAGRMDWFVAKMCGRYCAQSLMIPRNEESRDVCRNWASKASSAPIPLGRLNHSVQNSVEKCFMMQVGTEFNHCWPCVLIDRSLGQ